MKVKLKTAGNSTELMYPNFYIKVALYTLVMGHIWVKEIDQQEAVPFCTLTLPLMSSMTSYKQYFYISKAQMEPPTIQICYPGLAGSRLYYS